MKISDGTKSKLKDLVAEFSHCFSRHRHDLGLASFYKARLTLNRNFTPKWIPSREVPYKLRNHLSSEIEKMESSGQITRVPYSLWNSAIMLVGKSDGSYRFVQDCRALNTQCLQDNYQITNISTILDKMTEH